VSKKTRTIKIPLTWLPQVEAQVYGQKVQIKTGAYPNTTRFECTGELSVNSTVRLIKELRKALRAIRDHQINAMNRAVTDAEGPL